MRRFIISTVAFIVIVGGGYFFMGFLSSQKKTTTERPKPEVVNYVRAIAYNPTDIETEVEAYGRVVSSHQLNLTAEVGGRLLAGNLALKAGQNFSRGQLLFKIHSTEQCLSLKARKSTFLNLLASILPDLRIDFSDTYVNWQQYFDAIDLEKDLPELPKAQSSKEKTFLATKNILGEFYNIKSLEENLKKYSVYAPYTGSISMVNVQVGSIVNPGTQIGTIIRTDKLEVQIPIELRDIAFVEVGKRVSIVGQNGKSLRGEVVRVADLVDPNTQSINVFISVENTQKGDIYDGLYLNTKIPGKVVYNAMSIPRSVIRNKDEVFIVENDVLKTRTIVVQKVNGENAIVSGLNAGDLLVVDAPANASNNMKVTITEQGKVEEVPARREL